MADILTTERQTFTFRLLAVLVVGLAFVLAGRGDHVGLIFVLLVVYLVYAFALKIVLGRWRHPLLVYPMILVDAAFLGMIGYWGGNAGRLLRVAFPLMVPFYAIYGGYATALVAATATLAGLGLIQAVESRELSSIAFAENIVFSYALALLSGYLGHDRLRRVEAEEDARRLVRLEEGARSLSGAVRTIQEASDLGVMLQDFALAAPKLTGLPECLIGLLDRRSGALVTRATTTEISRLGVDRLDYLVEWPRPGSLTSETLAAHQPIALRDLTGDVPLPPPWVERLNVGALLAVPLASRGVDVGVMFFYGVPAGYPFSAQEVTLAQTYGEVVAHAAVNAQLYEDVQVTIAGVMSELRPVVLPKPIPRARRPSVIELGDLFIDVPNRQVKINNKPISLTPTEFDLLMALAENAGRAVDQETLLRRVWGEDYNGRSTVVDVGVHRLRRKVEDGPGAPRRIVTVRGSGYMLVPGNTVTIPRQGEER